MTFKWQQKRSQLASWWTRTAAANHDERKPIWLSRISCFKSITLYLIPQNECENLICFIFLLSALRFVSTWMLLIHKLMIIKSLQLAACSKYQSTTKDGWLYRNNEARRKKLLKISFLFSLFVFLFNFIPSLRPRKNSKKLKATLDHFEGISHPSKWNSFLSFNLLFNLILKLFILLN